MIKACKEFEVNSWVETSKTQPIYINNNVVHTQSFSKEARFSIRSIYQDSTHNWYMYCIIYAAKINAM